MLPNRYSGPRLFVLGLAFSVVGCSGPADIPDEPDLATLRAGYDAPSAMLDADNIMSVLEEAPPLEDLVAGFRSTNYLAGGVDDVSASMGQHAADRIRLQGAINVNLRCPGTLAASVYDSATNGSVSLTIAVADNSIRRTIGGQATRCALKGRLLDTEIPVMVDGPIAIDLGGDLSLRSRWSGRLLVSISGELRVADRISFTGLSARYSDDEFEHLLRLPDGTTVVISVSLDAIRIRGRNGSWVCDQAHSCSPV